MLTEGSTAPAEYVSYGYEVDMCMQSTNLFDVTKITANTYVSVIRNGALVDTPNSNTSAFIEVNPGDTYTIAWKKEGSLYSNADREILFFNAKKKYIGSYNPIPVSGGQTSFTFTAPSNAAYARFDYDKSFVNVMFTENSAVPAKYQPYSNTTIPIYIGDDQLGEDEYIDYGAGKIYRMINGVPTPTDPPVPLPALPTCDGTTITDYAGQSAAPSRFYAKYRKG
jgi:hypothetical protein